MSMEQPESVPSPGDFIKKELKARDWTQGDLSNILGRPLPTINRILQGKHAILPDMAIALGMAFGDGPEIWMQREAAYRLSLASQPEDDSISRRARIFAIAPVKEMQRRQWIKTTADIEELERELCRFFGIHSIDDPPTINVATRRSSTGDELTPQQLVWCIRARQLAAALKVGPFDPDTLDKCAQELRILAAHSEETRKVPNVLAKYGIRFVVVEHLQGSKIDGAAFWIDDAPAIAVSIRYDRIDAFWQTLCHELGHIKNGDAMSVDTDLAGEDQRPAAVKPDIERLADDFAVELLIPQKSLDSFVSRVSPLYAKSRIIQFAHRIRVHPGIIVGQLQYRGEIGYSANREMLVKVREFVAASAVTDGWGHHVSVEL